MRAWRKNSWLAAVAVACVLATQLLLPASRLGDHERAQRFGWQMFSTQTSGIEFVVETPTGTETIDVADYMARVRADIPFDEVIPAHLCNVVEEARSVVWEGGLLQCGTG